MTSLEIFAGAGGLALGTARSGFGHAALIEWDSDSCEALRRNISREDWKFGKWPVIERDIRDLRFHDYEGRIDVVSGGPPCQPFSIGGKHRGFTDARDMFPEAARVIREVKPRAFIFENVRGLLRKSFAKYFEYILLRLSYPELICKPGEVWHNHLNRLERHHTQGSEKGLHYRVVFRLLNAADYGVPQRRDRVFLVGFRSDIEQPWSFPYPTHSEDALLYSKWVKGDYWEEHGLAKRDRPSMTDAERRRNLLNIVPAFTTIRWQTVRDALKRLPNPVASVNRAEVVQGHRFQPGARSYPGHTGSPLDFPSKTLKAGDHGVPGGENMLALPDGSVRYFTVRESARLQTFPDDYLFPASWTESMRQIGNAVPVMLASSVSKSVLNALERHSQRVCKQN